MFKIICDGMDKNGVRQFTEIETSTREEAEEIVEDAKKLTKELEGSENFIWETIENGIKVTDGKVWGSIVIEEVGA